MGSRLIPRNPEHPQYPCIKPGFSFAGIWLETPQYRLLAVPFFLSLENTLKQLLSWRAFELGVTDGTSGQGNLSICSSGADRGL